MTLAPEHSGTESQAVTDKLGPLKHPATPEGQFKLFDIKLFDVGPGQQEREPEVELRFPLTAVVEFEAVGHPAVAEPDLPVTSIRLYDRGRGRPILEISPQQPGSDTIAGSLQGGISALVIRILGRWDDHHADFSKPLPADPEAYIEGSGEHEDWKAGPQDLTDWQGNKEG